MLAPWTRRSDALAPRWNNGPLQPNAVRVYSRKRFQSEHGSRRRHDLHVSAQGDFQERAEGATLLPEQAEAQAEAELQNLSQGSIEDGGEGLQLSTDTPADTASSIASLALLLSPFFFWGTSMVAMKALSPHTAPLFVSAFRMLPAGLVLLAWGARDGRPQPSGFKAWAWISVFALADATGFQGFLAEGLQRTTAGLGSVIIDSQPLSVAVMASILFGETLTSWGYLGLAMGVLGLCLLELPPSALESFQHFQFPGFQLGDGDVWQSGEFFMLLAAQSMAVGTILVRYVTKYADPIMATAYHMMLGGIPLLVLSAQREAGTLSERLPMLNGVDWLLLAYISILGSAASYGVFFYNASRGNLTALSSLTFSTPCFAAVTGFLVFGETLSPLQLFGATVTLAGVYLISKQPNK